MDQDVVKKIAELEEKIDKTYKIVHKLYVYFVVTAVITVLAIVLPLIGLVFVIPQFISSYTTNLQSAGLF